MRDGYLPRHAPTEPQRTLLSDDSVEEGAQLVARRLRRGCALAIPDDADGELFGQSLEGGSSAPGRARDRRPPSARRSRRRRSAPRRLRRGPRRSTARYRRGRARALRPHRSGRGHGLHAARARCRCERGRRGRFRRRAARSRRRRRPSNHRRANRGRGASPPRRCPTPARAFWLRGPRGAGTPRRAWARAGWRARTCVRTRQRERLRDRWSIVNLRRDHRRSLVPMGPPHVLRPPVPQHRTTRERLFEEPFAPHDEAPRHEKARPTTVRGAKGQARPPKARSPSRTVLRPPRKVIPKRRSRQPTAEAPRARNATKTPPKEPMKRAAPPPTGTTTRTPTEKRRRQGEKRTGTPGVPRRSSASTRCRCTCGRCSVIRFSPRRRRTTSP